MQTEMVFKGAAAGAPGWMGCRGHGVRHAVACCALCKLLTGCHLPSSGHGGSGLMTRVSGDSRIGDLRLPGVWRPAGPGGRYGDGRQGPGADMGHQDRDGEPAARPDQGGAGLDHGARPPPGRESGALVRPPGEPVAGAGQGAAGPPPRRAALCRGRRLHGGAGAAGGRRGAGAAVPGPDRGAPARCWAHAGARWTRRAKGHREHRVPLSGAALEDLRQAADMRARAVI